jgi:hypothetical protein
VGASASAQPVLTGPIVFSTNNTLENVQLIGSTGVAVNATGASNGTIQGVTIANDTAAVETVTLDNATGTFAIANCIASNLGGAAFYSTSSSGNLTWSMTNCSFGNITDGPVGYALTGAASQNLTVTECTFTGGNGLAMSAEANTTTTAALTCSNNTVNGDGSTALGLSVETDGTTAFTAILSNNTISNCTGSGMLLQAESGSSFKLDFENNTVTGSQGIGGDLVVTNGDNATVGAVFNNNTAGNYNLTQDGGTFSVEQFSTFSSRNTGTVGTVGTITNAAAGSLDIP